MRLTTIDAVGTRVANSFCKVLLLPRISDQLN